MEQACTLGPLGKRTQFDYSGSVKDGVTIEYTGRPRVSACFFACMRCRFEGQSIRGGFSMTKPHPDGLGAWVQAKSPQHNKVKLTPRHASHIAAILVKEGYAESWLEGNAVWLRFKS